MMHSTTPYVILITLALLSIGLAPSQVQAAPPSKLIMLDVKWSDSRATTRGFQKKNTIFPNQYVDKFGKFNSTARLLGGRSPKPKGGYWLNPICRSTTGEIGSATTITAGPKGGKIIRCFGKPGKVITNPSDFRTIHKRQLTNLRRIPTTTLRYGSRLLCLGHIRGQGMPGWIETPRPGKLPRGCKVKVMGKWTLIKDYSIFTHKAGPAATTPPKRDGWWAPKGGLNFAKHWPLYMVRWGVNDNARTNIHGYICRLKARNSNVWMIGRLRNTTGRPTCKSVRFKTEDSNNYEVLFSITKPVRWSSFKPHDLKRFRNKYTAPGMTSIMCLGASPGIISRQQCRMSQGRRATTYKLLLKQ